MDTCSGCLQDVIVAHHRKTEETLFYSVPGVKWPKMSPLSWSQSDRPPPATPTDDASPPSPWTRPETTLGTAARTLRPSNVHHANPLHTTIRCNRPWHRSTYSTPNGHLANLTRPDQPHPNPETSTHGPPQPTPIQRTNRQPAQLCTQPGNFNTIRCN